MLTCSSGPRFRPRWAQRGIRFQCWHIFPLCEKRKFRWSTCLAGRPSDVWFGQKGIWPLRPSIKTCCLPWNEFKTIGPLSVCAEQHGWLFYYGGWLLLLLVLLSPPNGGRHCSVGTHKAFRKDILELSNLPPFPFLLHEVEKHSFDDTRSTLKLD